jgi:hypothetical protein
VISSFRPQAASSPSSIPPFLPSFLPSLPYLIPSFSVLALLRSASTPAHRSRAPRDSPRLAIAQCSTTSRWRDGSAMYPRPLRHYSPRLSACPLDTFHRCSFRHRLALTDRIFPGRPRATSATRSAGLAVLNSPFLAHTIPLRCKIAHHPHPDCIPRLVSPPSKLCTPRSPIHLSDLAQHRRVRAAQIRPGSLRPPPLTPYHCSPSPCSYSSSSSPGSPPPRSAQSAASFSSSGSAPAGAAPVPERSRADRCSPGVRPRPGRKTPNRSGASRQNAFRRDGWIFAG